MSISEDQVRHIAKLAELHVNEADLPRLAAQFSGIVDFVAQLGEVEVPMETAPLAGPPRVALRPDEPRRYPLAHPPSSLGDGFTDGFFTVPGRDAGEGA
jgi:aspartyl-tRNA(Asn)/glutamyl-tRNA(Gln) amidotransferase subunit C